MHVRHSAISLRVFTCISRAAIIRALIIHDENTKEISEFICDFPQNFSLIFYGLHNIDLQTITTPLNLQNGSFLKPFKKRATRVLSNLRHSAIVSFFTPFLQHQVLTISNNIKYQVLTITLCT